MLTSHQQTAPVIHLRVQSLQFAGTSLPQAPIYSDAACWHAVDALVGGDTDTAELVQGTAVQPDPEPTAVAGDAVAGSSGEPLGAQTAGPMTVRVPYAPTIRS